MSGLLPIATEELLLQPVDFWGLRPNASHLLGQYQENQSTLHRAFGSTQLQSVLQFLQSHEYRPATQQPDQADRYTPEKHTVLFSLAVTEHQVPVHQKVLYVCHPLQSSP